MRATAPPCASGPTLTVTAVTGPSSAVAGTTINIGDTTKNQGADMAPASATSFYLSANSSIDAGDTLLGSRHVSALGAGLSETGTLPVLIPASTTPGTYYMIAIGDGDDVVAESQETNNTRAKVITISAAPSP